MDNDSLTPSKSVTARPTDTSPSGTEIPVIDLERIQSDAEGTIHDIFDAASRWGFLIIKNHGLPQRALDRMFEMSEDFFSQPSAMKEEKRVNRTQQGYDYKKSAIGVQESISFGYTAGSTLTSDNYSAWWTSEKRREIESFRAMCQKLSDVLLSCFSAAMGLRPSYFTTAHCPSKAPGNALIMLRYPALPATMDIPRLVEHTDWGTMTLLFAKTAGLEIRTPGDKDWVPVPVVENSVVVNIGDGLSLWSGKTLKSTMHRLSWESLPHNVERHSIAYFTNANADAPIKTLKRIVSPERPSGSSWVEDNPPFSATFGDYQTARKRLIDSFDPHTRSLGHEPDARLIELVKQIGVAHGAGFTLD